MSASLPSDDDRRPHDESKREALHTRVTAGAAETIRSFAKEQDVAISSLIDALLHALDDADRAWLDEIVSQARAFDVRSRSKTPQGKNTRNKKTPATNKRSVNGSRWT